MATTVYVKNVAAGTNDKEIKEFFSFCGKITSIDVSTDSSTNSKTATVTFEKETAARTALLLNHTKLGENEISVSGAEGASTPTEEDVPRSSDDTTLTQEEKPRARILAEILAHGYLVADTGLQTAIALDEKHGVTTKFVNTVKQLDERTHASDKARAADQSYGLTARANSLLTGLGSYFEKASQSPTGKKLVDFYTTSSRQVQDIHNEARRLADLKKQESGGSSYVASGLDKVLSRFGVKGPDAASSSEKKSNEEAPGAAPVGVVGEENKTGPVKGSGQEKPEVIS
ncbi:hypothetical protein QBC38DRAFT_56566 [Podospora fimiseda]|uniref:RRM domain-containing protein n=1 Tax=Podospora fimiseda TaxID=252190 RepID=A0AAN7H2I1_9PEZI|nr:hypothetical protein QBC38DRAFT_56566 [Podospora fimiseda]